jgi:hypothetical protein
MHPYKPSILKVHGKSIKITQSSQIDVADQFGVIGTARRRGNFFFKKKLELTHACFVV